MSTLQTIALIFALVLHLPWVKDRLDMVSRSKRPAVWFRSDGFWYGWKVDDTEARREASERFAGEGPENEGDK